ncbi:hypothetical protein [Trichloromonas sp.]|uniref:hypothetical protein n=1 Tax=Trichloromonas sp. TaxID=3069249 RepID=UPI002A391BBB|nr:hypothetical protein [Trichloromonas sp.]
MLPPLPCVVGNPGRARLYAIDWRTGEAVLNFHPDNDGEGAEAANPRALGLRRGATTRSGSVMPPPAGSACCAEIRPPAALRSVPVFPLQPFDLFKYSQILI